MYYNNLLPNLSRNLLEILNDDEYYDVTIEVGNDPYVKVFRAHMVILHYRSPYLRRILSTNKEKSDGTLTHIKLPNILPEIFQIILRYIYCGVLPLEEHDTSDIIKVLVAASELSLQELIAYIQSFLIVNKAIWMKLNFNLIYQTSFENDSFLELQKYCVDLISKEPDKILRSLNFSSFPEKLLISIIQDKNLQMSEIQVWEHVLKWGLAQHPELPSYPKDFSKEDFNILKNSMQRCILFIRFYDLTSEEFSDKVLPYKKVLPKELYNDLLKYFLNPNNQSIKKSKPCITEEIKEISQGTTLSQVPSMSYQEAYNYTSFVSSSSSRSHQMHHNQLIKNLEPHITKELKVIPNGTTSVRNPSISYQEDDYTSSIRASSSQLHQMYQQQYQRHQRYQQSSSPPGLEKILDIVTIERFLKIRNYEDAFVSVLASHDLPLILRLCNKVSPKSVFLPDRTLLSQPVILSIIHHLSLELNKFSELKRAWLKDAIIKLNPKDQTIREHCKRILPMVKQRLEEHYYQVFSQDAQSPILKNIEILIHAVKI